MRGGGEEEQRHNWPHSILAASVSPDPRSWAGARHGARQVEADSAACRECCVRGEAPRRGSGRRRRCCD